MEEEIIRKTVKDFQVLLHPDESGGFWVECPALPGCLSEGDTVEDALKNIQEAVELWLEDGTPLIENK